MKDYPEDDAEEVVLSRWGKIKQWLEIAMATKKLYLFVMSFLAVTGGSVIVGQATDTKPIRDAAVAMGLLEERPATDDIPDAVFDEIQELVLDIEGGLAYIRRLEERLDNHEHDEAVKDHTHDFPVPTASSEAAHDHNGLASINHTHTEVATHTHALTASETTSAKAIDDALLKHIAGDH